MSLKQYWLDLLKCGKLVAGDSVEQESSSSCPEPSEEAFDILGSLRVLPINLMRRIQRRFSYFSSGWQTRESGRSLLVL